MNSANQPCCQYKPGTCQNGQRFLTLFLWVVGMLFLPGCAAVGPDYVRQEPQAPEEWHTALQAGLAEGQANPELLAHWWTVLNDAQLSALMEKAVEGNLELKDAQSRILEARALRGLSESRLFPTLDTGASVSRSRSSESSSTGTERNLYEAGFDAGWELDIFGGVKRSVEAAQASLEATEEKLNNLRVSLLAEVALNYVDVRTYQARLDVSRANISDQQKIYALNVSRYQAGIIGELAVQESLRILESTRAQVPVLESGLNAAQNRLAVLLGTYPGNLHEVLSPHQPLPSLPEDIMVGIPAETLRHRPDVRSAERSLAAQTARIGVATADLYPKFRLFGSLGLEAVSAGDLVRSSSQTWGVGSGLSWTLFDAGAIRRNIQIQNARQEQALIAYERTVLDALEEVENALNAYGQEQQHQAFITKATVAAERAAELANDQYQAGLVAFNNVLDARRSLLTLQDEQVKSNGNIIANLVRLYKALGGGWNPVEE